MLKAIVITGMCGVVSISVAGQPADGGSGRLSSGSVQLPEEELEEVLVEGRRPVRNRRLLAQWMDRLVGDFRYEGAVESLDRNGDMVRSEVQGSSSCRRFDRAEAVHCLVNIAWSAVSNADGRSSAVPTPPPVSAVVVYGVDPARLNIGHLQVDGSGIAIGGKGWLVDDTLVTKAPCADFPNCLRVVRLQAPPDAKVISMRVDLERNGQSQVRYDLRWNRQPSAQDSFTTIETGEASRQVASRSPEVPVAIDTWLRQMPGEYQMAARDVAACWQALAQDKVPVAPDLDCRKAQQDLENAQRGAADAECQSIAGGPGVRCVMYMSWPELGLPVRSRWDQRINSTFLMYGFEPVTKTIAVVEVYPTAAVGPAVFAEGALFGDKLTYATTCSRPPCEGFKEVTVMPGGSRILFGSFPLGISSGMQRLQEGETRPEGKPAPRRPVSPRAR